MDSSLKEDPQVVLEKFHQLINSGCQQWDRNGLNTFLDTYFQPPGSDTIRFQVEQSVPNWFDLQLELKENFAAILNRVKDDQRDSVLSWVTYLFDSWRSLCLQVHPQVYEHPSRYTLIPWKKPMIVAGGRFREFYYWDSYFIIKGLLSCGLFTLARDMVDNLLDMVFKFGFVPNGGRIYYLNRSQPPLLSDMVAILVRNWCDDNPSLLTFLHRALQGLEKEYEFFSNYRSVFIGEPPRMLNRYIVNTSEPRPESFCSDMRLVKTLSEEQQREQCFCGLASAAESGWDFSSRWFEDGCHLHTICTQNIIPVCLNSILLRMEYQISSLYQNYLLLDSMEPLSLDTKNQLEQRIVWFNQQRSIRAQAMRHFLWDKHSLQWKDYDMKREQWTQRQFSSSASNYLPLWSHSIEYLVSSQEEAKGIVESFSNSGLLQSGGVLTTTFESGQQWDSPNAWPPLQDMLAEGFLALETFAPGCGALQIASKIVTRYIQSSYHGWYATGYMYEKYNGMLNSGQSGGGGEYKPQIGFGWTNGVALYFLRHYAGLIDSQIFS
ncbi:alpha,alpha-trehalase [Galdieria sulphuraria]|uniref:Trehalase n=1 Tax=Galdieria sulphuraria TaxID=130081 RepID=M2Y1B1_GALSU|nr:alpha,alpha-trehalase [Galdieria sulphuraria]EME29713.1 alpha,alpha-trehalase [Galdieria sulphuraria]|eukprot:XP_005706233.1 alpha,alpha-trehalase [Galdieria sulphuraria]